MNTLPSIGLACILVSMLAQVLHLFRKGTKPDPFSHWALAAAAVPLALFIAARSAEIGFPALTGTYESLAFYSMAVCAAAVAYRLRAGKAHLPFVQFGASVAALGLLALASSPLAPKEALPPIPALRSYWLVAHVALSFVGESLFVVSFVASVLFLAVRDGKRRNEYDRVSYTAVALGYPIFTLGAIVFGAVWAEQAWGVWWSWDPKETWALVTWLAYSLYLHLRLARNRRDALPSIVAIAGFLCALFTFFGVNFLLSGLHSYG